MPLSVALPFAALITLACAVVASGLLARGAGRSTASTRRAFQWLALGVSLGAVGVASAAALAEPGVLPLAVLPGSRLWAAPTALGLALAGYGLLAGLFRLPGAVETRGVGLRHVLDGALLACCALHVSWTLFIEPVYMNRLERPISVLASPRWLVVAVPVVAALVVCGVSAVVVGRTSGPRRDLFVTGTAIAISTLLGLALVLALRKQSGTLVMFLALLYGLSLVGVAVTPRCTARGCGRAPVMAGSGTLLALVPASGAILAAIIRIAVFQDTDNISIWIAAGVGALLVTRQTLATRDAHEYARRLAEREAHFRDMAYTDALTGLGNRRALSRALQDRPAGENLVLLALDLDGFKDVNDLRGHDAGDMVLSEVARRLRASMRADDMAVRQGGDEFAVLLSARPDQAYEAARRLLTLLSQPYEVGMGTVFLSASIGLADWAASPDASALIHNADLALRFAKQRGKNRVERYDAAYDHWMRRRNILEQALRGAVERDELSVAYQPVMFLPQGRAVGVEALLRWRHPTLGQISPAEFIPVAEEVGIIGRLDRWVLHQACRQLSRWLGDGHDVWMSVNISVQELHLPEYVTDVVDALRTHGVPPSRLVLEVTEHAVAVDLDELISRLGALRATGVRIALDDFGAGYSSLGQLQKLPADILKIDHTLVAQPESGRSRPSAPLVDVVVRLGQRLGLEVIAEGVAEATQREVVETAGCRLGQGNLFCRAMPAEHIEALLAAPVPVIPIPRVSHDVGRVDSARQMRQS